MKFKKLFNYIIPLASCSIVVPTMVACSNEEEPITSKGVDITHQDGSITHYDTFESAIENVKENDTVSLREDVILSNRLEFKLFKNVTINGNGHTIDFNVTTAVDDLLSIENCYNLTMKNITISGVANWYCVCASASDIHLDSVNIVGSAKTALYINGNASADITNCYFKVANSNINTYQTMEIYTYGGGGDLITISNTYMDSLSLTAHDGILPRVSFGEGVYMRYISASNEITTLILNDVIKNLSKVQDLWFVGHAQEINSKIAYYTSLTAEVKNEIAYYIVNADGLEEFNKLYTTSTEARPVELHLMGDIDYSNKVWTPIFTTDQDTEVYISNWANITLFDGHNHTISNLYIDESWDKNTIGFFASVGNTTTQNVTFDSCHLEDKDNQNAGMIYGYVVGKAAILNTTVSNSYIGALKKAATFVGVVDNRKNNTDPTAYDQMACVKLSNCTSYECRVVNKDTTQSGQGLDIYLGGLVAWLRYHDGSLYNGYLDIDDDPDNKIYITNIHFDWQQEATEDTDGFEVGMIFLYGHYRQCNSYTNVVVHYEGE